MNLRHPRLADAKHRADFFHREFLEVVEREHVLFFLGQFRDGSRQQMLHLRTQAEEKRRILRCFGQRVGKVFFLAVPRRLNAQAADFEAIEFGQQGCNSASRMPIARASSFPWGAAQFEAELAVGLLDLARLAAQLARSPVNLPQAVKDGAPNAELGVGTELHMLGVVELVQRVDQPDTPAWTRSSNGTCRGRRS